MASRSAEKLDSAISSPEKREKKNALESKNVKDAAEGIGSAVQVETMADGTEVMEAMGNVSENVGEGREIKGDSSGAKGDDDDQIIGGQGTMTAAQVKAALLKKVPNEPAMRRQIKKEVEKEIDYLHKKAMKMVRSPGEVNYYEMSNIVRKIRELKLVLLELVQASVDKLKTLWLRFVHGIM